jgi:hypothetical protein
VRVRLDVLFHSFFSHFPQFSVHVTCATKEKFFSLRRRLNVGKTRTVFGFEFAQTTGLIVRAFPIICCGLQRNHLKKLKGFYDLLTA